MIPSSFALLISLLRPSIRITNRKGERVSTCRKPREGVNWAVGAPLTRMENWKGAVFRVSTRTTKVGQYDLCPQNRKRAQK